MCLKIYIVFAGKVEHSSLLPASQLEMHGSQPNAARFFLIQVKYESSQMNLLYYNSSCWKPGSGRCIQFDQRTHCVMVVEQMLYKRW
jgi:hypothetical protein